MKHKFIALLSLLLFAVALASVAWGQDGPPLTTTELIVPVTQVNLVPVTQANVALVGNPGPQTIYYWIVTNFTLGSSSPVGPFVSINAPNVLSGSNYITVTPSYTAGIASIDLLKTSTPTPPSGACNCAVSTGVSAGAINDQSNSTSSYTVAPVVVGNYTLTLTNEVQGAGSTHLILRQSTNGQTPGVFICDLSIGCGSGGITGATPNGGLVQTGTTLGMLTTCGNTQVLAFNGTAWVCSNAGTGTVTGTGTNNTITKWTGASSIGNSGVTDNGAVSTSENVFVTAPAGISSATSAPACLSGSYTNAAAGCQSVTGTTNITAGATGLAAGLVGSINPTVNLTGTPQLAGVFGSAILAGNGSPASLAGVVGVSQPQGSTGTIAISSGVFGLGTVGQPGGVSQNATVLEGVGGQASVSHAGQTNPTAIALHAYSPTLTGAATNVYGLLVEDQTGGGANNPNPHAIVTLGTAPSIFGGLVTAPNFTDSALTPGGCVQAGTAGILTTPSGTACGAGSAFSLTVNGGAAVTAPVNFQNGTNTTVTNPSGSNVQYNVATASTITAGIVKLANDFGGTALLPSVQGINSVPLCTGFTPTNGQALQYTTGSSPNPCYTASSVGIGTITGVTAGPGLSGGGSSGSVTVTAATAWVDASRGYVSGDPCATAAANLAAAVALNAQGVDLDFSNFANIFTDGLVPCNSNPFENQVVSGSMHLGPIQIVKSVPWVTPGNNQRFSILGDGTSDPGVAIASTNSTLTDCDSEAPGWNGTACVVHGVTVAAFPSTGHCFTFTYPHGSFGAGTYCPSLWLGGMGAAGVNFGGSFGAVIRDFNIQSGSGGGNFSVYSSGVQEQSLCYNVVGRASNNAGFFFDKVQGNGSGPGHWSMNGCTSRMDLNDTAAQGYPNVANQVGMGYGIWAEGNGIVVYFTGGTCTTYPQGYPTSISGGAITAIKMTYAGTCSNVTGLTCHIGTNHGGTGETCSPTTVGNTVTGITAGGTGSGYNLSDTQTGAPFEIANATINGKNTASMRASIVLDGLFSAHVSSIHTGFNADWGVIVGYGSGVIIGGLFENVDLENTSNGEYHIGVGIDNSQIFLATGRGGSVASIKDDTNGFSSGTSVPCSLYEPGTMNTCNSGGVLVTTNTAVNTVPLTVNAIVGQTSDLQDWTVNGVTEASLSAAGAFNVATGFQIGGAAASRSILAGNGTNFVSTLAGVPVDATNPATLLSTDRASYLTWTSGTALALPAVASSFASNYPFVLQNTAGSTLTITPNAAASDLIDGSASGTVLNNFASFVYQDSTTAPGHWFTIKYPTLAAFPAACGDTGGNHVNFTVAGGFTCGTSSVGGTPSENNVTGATAAASITETGATFSITRAGVATGNLIAPWVFQNTNSSNNNTSIGLAVTTPGTSTGQVSLNVNGATTQAALQAWGTGATYAAGVQSGQTVVAQLLPTGAMTFGATLPTITTPGTGFSVFGSDGTEPSSISAGASGFVMDSTSNCPVQWNNSTNVGCTAALGATETFTGIQTFSPAARTSGAVPYLKVNIPADTGQTASTESIGYTHATGTRTWATTGTVALQRENFFAGPTYASASASQTFTDAFTLYATPPIAGTNAIFTRGHTLGIVDSTSATTSTTGGLVVATTLGTTATSVGIGGGNINAGGSVTVGGGGSILGILATGSAGQFTVNASGLPTKSNNKTLAGQGNALIVGVTSQKAETGAADASVLSVTPAAAVGTYEVCVSISVSTATAGVIAWTLNWTDSNGNAQVSIAAPLTQFGTAAPNTTFTTSAAGNYSGCMDIDINTAAAAIVVKWVGGGTTAAKMSATVKELI